MFSQIIPYMLLVIYFIYIIINTLISFNGKWNVFFLGVTISAIIYFIILVLSFFCLKYILFRSLKKEKLESTKKNKLNIQFKKIYREIIILGSMFCFFICFLGTTSLKEELIRDYTDGYSTFICIIFIIGVIYKTISLNKERKEKEK